MFNDSMQGISVLTYSIFNSISDIIKSNQHESVVSDKVQFVSGEGDIYFPMDRKLNNSDGSDKIPTFIKDKNADLNMMRYATFIDEYIDSNITTITFNKSVYLPTILKRLAQDENTYGVIIQSKDNYMINPLHPAIAFSITTGLMDYPEEGELHIFEWSDGAMAGYNRQSADSKKEEKDFYEKEYGQLFKLFQYLLRKPVIEKRTATIDGQEVQPLIDSPLLEDITAEVKIRIDSDSGLSSRDIKNILIPTQLAIGNMATPYYGMMYLTDPTSSDIRGYNITPMLSGNLQQGLGGVNTYRDTIRNTSSGNVCAGSQSSNGHLGWSTLSKININSMFDDKIVSAVGLMSFVESSKEVSATIWEGVEQEGLQKIRDLENPGVAIERDTEGE